MRKCDFCDSFSMDWDERVSCFRLIRPAKKNVKQAKMAGSPGAKKAEGKGEKKVSFQQRRKKQIAFKKEKRKKAKMILYDF